MGLFDFVKDIGEKLDGGDDDGEISDVNRALQVKQYVRKLGLPVDDLKFAFEDGTVTITGSVPSQEDLEKIVLATGNTEGVGQVNDDGVRVVAPEVDQPEVATGSSGSGGAAAQATQDAVKAANGEVEPRTEKATKAAARPKRSQPRFYTVEKGDTLSKIAKEYYGDAMKYPVIFEANRPMLEDPDLIYPGQKLRIPELTK